MEPGDREEEIRAKGIEILRIPFTYSKLPIFVFRLGLLIRNKEIDILHTHLGWLGSIELFVAWACRVKIRIVYFHSGDWLHSGGFLRSFTAKLFEQFGRALSTHCWAPSETALVRWVPWLPKVSPNRRVIPGGIAFAPGPSLSQATLRKTLNLPLGSWYIGHVGRFTPEKGHKCLLSAFKYVLEAEPTAVLVCVGDGPLKEELEQLCNDLGISERVVFPGTRDDVVLYLHAIDVFAFPSSFESLGLAVLEAQDAGLPSVASDLPVFRESITDRWHPFFFTPGASKDLAQKLLAVRNEVRMRPDSFLEPFSLDSAKSTLMTEYKSALNKL